jgi:hypothetical protein
MQQVAVDVGGVWLARVAAHGVGVADGGRGRAVGRRPGLPKPVMPSS